ncbi:MAG TPA: phage terminase large subunit [Pseudolabrys sp.]
MALKEREVRRRRKAYTEPGGLLQFVRDYWHIVEPARPLIEGWPLEAICEHLEAISRGQIKRLLMNVPPGFMKSLLTNVFFPAHEWGPMGMPWLRYIAASYSQALTIRDNVRFRNIIASPQYRADFGHVFGPSKDQFSLLKVGNDQTGWKLATSVGGVGTGERGNRFIIDDGNSVAEAESQAVTESTNQWFTEVVPTRLNSLDEDVIINIQQRTGELDISGVILSKEMGYVHLMIPMEYDDTRHCHTVLGWSDPRTKDGELAWEARFSRAAVTQLKKDMGPYAVAGQLQQRPTPRGGGIIKRSYWELWEGVKFPDTLSFVVASLDPAYTEKQENDPSGFTVWGLFKDKSGNTKIILMDAWLKRLELHGADDLIARLPNETYAAWRRRTEDDWGLVEWVAHTCMRFKVDRLLIEAKASGLTVAQEIRRLYGNSGWIVETLDPKNQDKVARAYSIQPMMADGMIYAPERPWAELVIEECEAFKAGAPRDNLVDSTTQALRWFRDHGLADRREERAAAERDLMMHRSPQGPLYPV